MGNQAAVPKTFPLPHLLEATEVSLSDPTRVDTDPKGQYKITFTVGDATASEPSPALWTSATDHYISIKPAGSAVIVGTPTETAGDATNGYAYEVTFQLQFGVTSAMVGISSGYAIQDGASVTLPPVSDPDPAPVTAEVMISSLNETDRSFRLEVAFTVGMKSDGSAGDPVTAFDSSLLTVTDADMATVLLTVEAERAPTATNQTYVAILKYDQLATLLLTITIKDYKDTSDSTMDAAGMVGMDDGDGDGDGMNAAPVVAISTEAPASAVAVGSFAVMYTATDTDTGDTVDVTAALDAASVTAGYTVSPPANGMVTITQPTPNATTTSIPAATVTITITANDGTVDSAAMTLSVPFAARTYDPGDVTDPVVAIVPVAGDQSAAFDVTFTVIEANLATGGVTAAITPAGAVEDAAPAATLVSGNTTYKVTVTPKAATATATPVAAATITITLTATDTAGNSSSQSIAVSFLVFVQAHGDPVDQ